MNLISLEVVRLHNREGVRLVNLILCCWSDGRTVESDGRTVDIDEFQMKLVVSKM